MRWPSPSPERPRLRLDAETAASGGGRSRAGPCKTHVPPHFFGLAQRNGSGAPKKNAPVLIGAFLRVFTGFQASTVVIPLSNAFSASPSVHCFAYARGTADHHPVSGASEAKPTAVGVEQGYPTTG